MLEQKDNKRGNLVICNQGWRDSFTEGSVYEIRKDGTGRVLVVKDDSGNENGWGRQNFDLYEPTLIEEVPQKFTVGSKWITKCDIYANDGMAKAKWLGRGCFLEVVVERFGVVEFNDDVWLNEEEALLLLEPYTEPLKEMTAEQIAKEFNVKVVE